MTPKTLSIARLSLPREHGFWAMLLTVLVTALLRTPPSFAVAATTLAVLGVSSLLGGHYATRIRRSAGAQLSASLALAFAGLPVEVVGRAPWPESLATTALWAALFLSSALLVRAAFARAGAAGRDLGSPRGLTNVAVSCTLISTAAFYAFGLHAHAASAAIGAVGSVAIALWKPSVKRLKAVGIALAVLLAASGLVLTLYDKFV